MSWAHAPLHRFGPGAIMMTGATYQKSLFFSTPERKTKLQESLFEKLKEYQWKLQA